ncbi:restriction endonuclease subunit S [Streptomyces sp. NPDC050619]|uniref:restriction endonuclease subunit S n=1 Tax=Streptomyces sp. NPDC050619 TaxID=3157214 RepID=UPI0034281A9A
MSASKVEGIGEAGREGLPEGWAWATVGDILVAPVVNGRSVRTEAGGFPVLRLTALRSDNVDLSERKEGEWTADEAAPYLVRADDFLICRGSGSLDLVGRGALVPEAPDPVAFPDTMIRVRVPAEHISPRFLTRLWASPLVREQIECAARTTAGIYKVSQPAVREVKIPLPPTAEQHRIAAALDTRMGQLDTIEVKLSAALNHLDALQNSTMAAAATGLLDPEAVPAAAPTTAAADLDDGSLPDLADGWIWSRLADIAEVVGGVTKDSKRQSDEALPEVPYLRVANAQRAHLNLSQVAKIRVPVKTLSKLRLKSGDLLLTEGGDRDKLGRGWIWENQIKECIHQNHLFRARIQDDTTHPKLLAWYTNSAARGWFESHAKQSVNLASISMSKVRNLPVPIPPQAKQIEAVAAGEQSLGRLKVLVELTQQALTNTAMLRRALLAEAFSGRLVPQDPADEPAEELLKRIRVEREIAEAERKTAPKATRARGQATASPPPAKADDTILANGEQTALPLEFNS